MVFETTPFVHSGTSPLYDAGANWERLLYFVGAAAQAAMGGVLLRAGMEAPVDVVEAGTVHVGVDLRGGDVRVAEHFLDDPKIRIAFEQVAREGVAEKMGVDSFLDASPLACLSDELPDAGAGEAASGA